MNVVKCPEGQRPKATDVSPWYGIYLLYNSPLYFPRASEAKSWQFYLGSEPLWAWVCSIFDRQDAINELLYFILHAAKDKSGGPIWIAVHWKA